MIARRRSPASERPVLGAHTIYRTTSAVSALACSRAVFPQVTRFDALDADAPFDIHSRAVQVGDVTLMAVSTTGHRITLEDHGRLGLLVPLRGRIGTDDGRREATAAPGAVLLPGLGRRTTTCGRDYEGLVAMARTTVLEERLAADLGRTAWDVLDGLGAVPGDGAPAASLVDFVHCVVRDIDRGGPLARLASARTSASQLLLDHLTEIFLRRGEELGRIAPAVPASAWQVAKAEAYIRAHVSEPLSIVPIAAAIGTSTRSLQLAFRRHRDTTPRAFIQACRLDLLHRRLARADPGTRVIDLAADCGIAHLGRCAEAYRRRFGENPSETLARAARRA